MADHLPMERFPDNALAALANQPQRAALRSATDTFAARRQQVLASQPDWEAWREQARQVKDHTLAHLDHYLLQFEQQATARGSIVHWARDANEAVRLVLELAQQHGGGPCVKAKSMTSEEIRLNEAMAAAGIEAVETDLGEWIQQLADEVPFHIVVPAIHKSRQAVAALFADKLGTAADADAATLTAVARERLRAAFAKARVGISGANFAIAETGSLLLLENEGNIRLTTSLPEVHIAIVGIEKLLPRLLDLDVFLRLLPRAGTGQSLTTYQSLLTGQSPGKAVHIVLLDNGRSRMLATPVQRQSLACIRCGACLNVCPVYQQVGGHAYGSVYPGPIGAVVTPQLVPLARAGALPFASTLCGACRDVCPVKIDIPALLLHLRQQAREGLPANGHAAGGNAVAGQPSHPSNHQTSHQPPQQLRRGERLALQATAFLLRHPRAYRLAMASARLLQRFAWPLLQRLPPLARMQRQRQLPRLAPRSFREVWRGESGRDGRRR